MRKAIIIASLSFLVVAASPALAAEKAKPVESQWSASAVTIDGFDTEWAGARRIIAEDGVAEYAVMNDGANLYLLFAIRDPKFMTNISRTGLTVYFDAAGKKSKDHGLRLVRSAVPTENYIAALEKGGATLTDEKKAEMRKQPYQILFACVVIGPKADKNAPAQPADPTKAPVYAAVGNQSFVLFECRIPLSREGQPGGIGVEPGKPLKLGFEWGGAPKKGDLSGPRNPGLGDTSSESPERESEIFSEGGGLDDIQLRQRSPKKYSFWTDVQLAAGR